MKLGAAHRGDCRCDRDRDCDRERPAGGAGRLSVPGHRLLKRLEGPGEVWGAEGPGGFREIGRAHV